MNFETYTTAHGTIRSVIDLKFQITDDFFNPTWVKKNTAILGQGLGRGTAIIFKHKEKNMVLRHYNRGGIFGRILADRYLRLHHNQTRAFKELALLGLMRNAGLPVPPPVAARVSKHGIFYRADILVEEIPNSQTLFDVMAKGKIHTNAWAILGKLIARFHAFGIDHTDLNIHNIMMDADQNFWLIDFDKCRKRKQGAWCTSNLSRLHRSFEKQHSKHPLKGWEPDNWAALLRAYNDV